ncbi:MAG TPA: phytanoyl-CoA dioxygenase family protein [Acidimicrobiales bacterium]
MITRRTGYLSLSDAPVPAATEELQRDGFTVRRGVFDEDEVRELVEDIERVYAEYPPDERVDRYEHDHWEPFRYEMLNRSAVVQRAIASRTILDVIEPLLGEDCHVIANTAWRQPPQNNDHGGRSWHIDAGPHIPRPPGVPWDERIPYPVFAIATHLYLWDCPLEAGATGVLRGSHTSGQAPPLDRMNDDDLEWNGERAVPLVANAGDVALFASDVWHRRLPSGPGEPGRFFLQCHYGRRDLAQRLRPTSVANQLSDEARERATTSRERSLIGLHRPFFYDG